jgi:hypothetical protein
MTGLIFARFARPNARLLFADNPVISMHDGEPTLMVRFANQRNSLIGNATARLWMLRNEESKEGRPRRRFTELSLERNESPALVLSWTLFHVIDENSPLYGLSPDDMTAANMRWRRKPSTRERPTSTIGSGMATATPISCRRWMMAGSRSNTGGSTRPFKTSLSHSCHADFRCKWRRQRDKS